MKIPLSARLLACCNYVKPNSRVADIGCDHGYLGIHLLKTGVARSVIAADVNEGPLQSAMRNAVKFGVRNRMEFFISDGVCNIPLDFDTMVCAGMGADTMIHIFNSTPWLRSDRYCFILQCQSKTPALRRYLSDHGWYIQDETIVRDGKFLYTVMCVYWCQEAPRLSFAESYITPALLRDNSPLLPEYFQRVKQGVALTVSGLERSGDDRLPHFQKILSELTQMEEIIYGNRS